MKDKSILVEKRNTIGILRFNRPDNRNCMDAEILEDFKSALNQIREDDTLRCVIITGSGSTFCGGADLKNSIVGDGSVLTPDALMDFYGSFLQITTLSVPVIAAVNGHAIGGGFGLALLCDMRIVGEIVKLGANFARLGLHCGMAVSFLLPRLVGLANANELLYTGKLITGKKACEIGLANTAVSEEKVFQTAVALAEEIAVSAPAAVQMMKKSVYDQLDWQIFNAARMESQKQAKTFGMEDSKEGIAALLEKRPPVFRGC